ncbi:MAG: MFS transporter [Chloroflexota bacterium]|nr:MAG: MFS transporter [Chloroflexota bacterium]
MSIAQTYCIGPDCERDSERTPKTNRQTDGSPRANAISSVAFSEYDSPPVIFDRLARIWYGWWLVAITTLLIALQSAVYVFGFGVFFAPIVAEFGWSRAVASGAVSLARLEGAMTGPLEGWLIDRFGPRRIMAIGVPIFALGWLALSQVDSLVSYYLVYVFLLSVGSSLGFFTACSTAVANWFVRRRSLALGIMSCGIGVGTLFVPAVAALVEGVGWRTAALVIAIVVLIIGLPLVALVRHRPERYGQAPDGKPASAAAPADQPTFTARQAFRMPAFWILALSFGVRIMATTAISLHFIPLMIDIGLGAAVAAWATAALGLISIVGRLGLGWLADRWGQRTAYAIGLVSLMASFVVLANASSTEGIALFLLLYGPAYGGLAALMLAIRADYFGSRSFATIGGLMTPVMTLGTLSGPVFAGWVFDTTGTYRGALYTFAAMMLVALGLLAMLRRRPVVA